MPFNNLTPSKQQHQSFTPLPVPAATESKHIYNMYVVTIGRELIQMQTQPTN